MAETIQISDPKITMIKIDAEREAVVVRWCKETTSGIKVEAGTFVFWKTIPSVSNPPSNWYVLGSTELSEVISIINMAQNFIEDNVS